MWHGRWCACACAPAVRHAHASTQACSMRMGHGVRGCSARHAHATRAWDIAHSVRGRSMRHVLTCSARWTATTCAACPQADTSSNASMCSRPAISCFHSGGGTLTCMMNLARWWCEIATSQSSESTPHSPSWVSKNACEFEYAWRGPHTDLSSVHGGGGGRRGLWRGGRSSGTGTSSSGAPFSTYRLRATSVVLA